MPKGTNSPLRNWLLVGITIAVAAPAPLIRLSGVELTSGAAVAISGVAILSAAFLLTWTSEAAEVDVSRGLALALIALIAVLPEYAVDLFFAWTAPDVHENAHFATANMTGANRLLVGIAWPTLVLIFWLRTKKTALSIRGDTSLGLVVLVFVAARPRLSRPGSGSVARSLAFVAGVLPGVVALSWIQSTLYGSPFRSGYGNPEQLFSLAHLWPNLQRYPRWLLETHTPLLCLSLAAPFVIRARARSAGSADGDPAFRLSIACLVLAALVFASYLVYVPFDEWWYIRFLLPAIPLLVALSVTTLAAIASRLVPPWRTYASLAVVLAVVIFNVHTARDRGLFAFRDSEQRFVENGSYIASRLPDRAVVLTTWESGSVRFYGRRLSILWDSLDPVWLDRAISFLQREGRPPYLLFETGEEQQFRDRFAPASRYGALDWPPMAQLPFGVRLYNPVDRDRYLAGQSVSTERVWPSRKMKRPGR